MEIAKCTTLVDENGITITIVNNESGQPSNELASIIEKQGDLTLLKTILKNNIVEAMNEIYDRNNITAVDIKSFGAVGDGVSDDTVAILTAISYAIENNIDTIYKPYGLYKVTQDINLIAPLIFQGSGIFIDINGKVISFMENQNLIFGAEYLTKYYSKLNAKEASKIVFSGDSTTELGNFVAYSDDFIKRMGIATNVCINAGHSGATTSHWLSNNWIDADLSQNPDLYILRWGLNDTNADFSIEKIREFETNLRSGLKRIRDLKTSMQLSILLMTPNAVGMAYKDKKWGQQINSVMRRAARDFKCCFADTYKYLEDVCSPNEWLDQQLIHPNLMGDKLVVDFISDILVPNVFRTYLSTGQSLFSDFKKADVQFLASLTPSEIVVGVSNYRATMANGFPIEGSVTTINNADRNICKQEIVAYDSSSAIRVRTWNEIGRVWNAWKAI